MRLLCTSLSPCRFLVYVPFHYTLDSVYLGLDSLVPSFIFSFLCPSASLLLFGGGFFHSHEAGDASPALPKTRLGNSSASKSVSYASPGGKDSSTTDSLFFLSLPVPIAGSWGGCMGGVFYLHLMPGPSLLQNARSSNFFFLSRDLGFMCMDGYGNLAMGYTFFFSLSFLLPPEMG